jgi:hypothetical protein
MTTQIDYTAEEWKSILQAPAMAGMVVMLTGQSGPFQMVKEMFAVNQAMVDAEKQGDSNELIGALVAAARSLKPEDMQPAQKFKTIEEARAYALDRVRQAATLVDQKAPAQEARGFKQWLAFLGQKVAEAAKEGGFLGFGGVQVTEEEKTAVSELATALGISLPKPTS